jgi:hypothetical protein
MKTAARRRSAKPGEQRRNRPLVRTDKEANEQNHRQGRRIGAPFPWRNRAPDPFLFSPSCSCSGWKENNDRFTSWTCRSSSLRKIDYEHDYDHEQESEKIPAPFRSRNHSPSSAANVAEAAAGRAMITSHMPLPTAC